MNTAERLLRGFINAVIDARNKGGLSAVTPWLSSLTDDARIYLSSIEAKESAAPQTSLPKEPAPDMIGYINEWRDYALALRSFLAQREERIRELKKEIIVLRHEERIQNIPVDFTCAKCGLHITNVHHRYAPFCLKCVYTYHSKNNVSMIDAHRALDSVRAEAAARGEGKK